MSDPFGPWQGPWQQQPPPSPLPQPEPEKNNRWIVLATLTVVAVLVVVVMVIVAFIIDPRTESTPKRQAAAAQSSAAPQTTYSTSDPNAIRILTEEATCDEFKALNWDGTTLVVGLPNELTWSAQDRAAAADTARQFSEAADKVTPLMARASSNFVREMYGQLIAYARAFANWLPTTDGNLADRRYFDLGYASGAADRIVSSLCGTLDRWRQTRTHLSWSPSHLLTLRTWLLPDRDGSSRHSWRSVPKLQGCFPISWVQATLIRGSKTLPGSLIGSATWVAAATTMLLTTLRSTAPNTCVLIVSLQQKSPASAWSPTGCSCSSSTAVALSAPGSDALQRCGARTCRCRRQQ